MSPARSRLSFLFSRVALVGMPMRLSVLIICRGDVIHNKQKKQGVGFTISLAC
jgi:hypothetical protein